jgi:hypothetical protein
MAVDLEQPLLSVGWSAAFSFAKCHLEETTPSDNYAPYAMPVEQFSRFARFWTRGYVLSIVFGSASIVIVQCTRILCDCWLIVYI